MVKHKTTMLNPAPWPMTTSPPLSSQVLKPKHHISKQRILNLDNAFKGRWFRSYKTCTGEGLNAITHFISISISTLPFHGNKRPYSHSLLLLMMEFLSADYKVSETQRVTGC